MDEIKSVISQLPPQDIAILKAIYNPESAKADLTDNAQRMIAILDWLSIEEQQEAVDVAAEELPQPEEWDLNVEVNETSIEWEAPVDMDIEEEEKINPAWNLEDFLI